jgi:hypothetical protein
MSKFLALFIFLAAQAEAQPLCAPNVALVTLDSSHTKDFIFILNATNSMPLDGKVLSHSGDLDYVQVSVPADYAERNHLRSFDVASKVAGIAESLHLDIRKIEAAMCYAPADYDASNVGTIGHGK